MIVAIFGVLKAGGGYVPLDPENPPERNRFICQDVGAIVAITVTEYASVFDAVPTLLIDTVNFCGQWTNCPDPKLTPEHLAYAIYTSGSTGMPKGVLIDHKSAASLVESRIKVEGYKSDWRTLLFPNYVFDVSAGDIFTALSAGKNVFLERLHSKYLTRLQVVPSVSPRCRRSSRIWQNASIRCEPITYP